MGKKVMRPLNGRILAVSRLLVEFDISTERWFKETNRISTMLRKIRLPKRVMNEFLILWMADDEVH